MVGQLITAACIILALGGWGVVLRWLDELAWLAGWRLFFALTLAPMLVVFLTLRVMEVLL